MGLGEWVVVWGLMGRAWRGRGRGESMVLEWEEGETVCVWGGGGWEGCQVRNLVVEVNGVDACGYLRCGRGEG